MARSTRTPAPKTKVADAPAAGADAEPSPRTVHSRERFAQACTLVKEFLADGEFHSSNEIHRALGKQVPEGMFGRAKKELGIVHTRRRPEGGGRAEYFWKLPATK